MLYSEENVRANIRNRDGQRVFYLGKFDLLTGSARDWLNRERIPILPAEEARPERYRLIGGGFTEEKPEHMTHLNAQVLVPKTHPRILFRGKMDTLEAELILCQLTAQRWKADLGEILALARQILRADVLEEPLKWERLCGLTEQEQRKRSHFPQDYYGQPHFMPAIADGETVLRLNRLRCAVRNAERALVAALPERTDLIRGMNRMSSGIYILMIRMRKHETENHAFGKNICISKSERSSGQGQRGKNR